MGRRGGRGGRAGVDASRVESRGGAKTWRGPAATWRVPGDTEGCLWGYARSWSPLGYRMSLTRHLLASLTAAAPGAKVCSSGRHRSRGGSLSSGSKLDRASSTDASRHVGLARVNPQDISSCHAMVTSPLNRRSNHARHPRSPCPELGPRAFALPSLRAPKREGRRWRHAHGHGARLAVDFSTASL